MVVPFGISVGDVIAILCLFKGVGTALKDSGGASTHYCSTIRNLETIQAILDQLEHLRYSKNNVPTVNAIRAQANQVKHDVQIFIDQTEKYKNTLGAQGKRGFYHGTSAKIRWSQFVASEVEHLSAAVQTQVTNIHLLLGLITSDSTSDILNDQQTLGRFLAQSTSRQEHAIADAKREITSVVYELAHLIEATQAQGCTQITHARTELSLHLEQLGLRHKTSNQRISDHMATAQDIQDLKALIQKTQTIAPAAHTGSAINGARIALTLTIPRLELSAQDLKDLLQHFLIKIEMILRLFSASFIILLRDFVFSLPQVLLVVQVLRRLPPIVSLLLRDNIAFEDALGRTQSLQYQQFRHWPVFEANLLCHFKQVPGCKKVRNGHFVLLSPDVPGGCLSARSWDKQLKPGSTVKMSISIKTFAMGFGQCPRRCAATLTSQSTWESCCSKCGLVFMLKSRILPRTEDREPRATPDSIRIEAHLGKPHREESPRGDGQLFNSADGEANLPCQDWLEERSLEFEEMKVLKRICFEKDFMPMPSARNADFNAEPPISFPRKQDLLREAQTFTRQFCQANFNFERSFKVHSKTCPAVDRVNGVPTDEKICEYFLPGFELSRNIVLSQSKYFLGDSAIVRPYQYRGRAGYLIKGIMLSPHEIEFLKLRSREYERQQTIRLNSQTSQSSKKA